MLFINRIVRNFLSVSTANIVSQLLVFVAGTYSAKIIGRGNFGELNTVQSFFIYITMVTLFGLQTYGTREIAKKQGNTATILGEILSLRFILAVICSAIVAVSCLAISGSSLRNLLLLYCLTLLPSALNLDWYFTGIQEMQHNAVYNVMKSFVPAVLILVFLHGRNQVYFIPIFTCLGLLAALLYQFYILYGRKRAKINWGLTFQKGYSYLGSGIPFLISGILAMINCNVDRIIINFSRGSEEAGVYSAAYYIVLFLTNVVAMIFTPVFPLMIEYFHQKEHDRLKSLLQVMTKILVWLSIPLAFGGIILSQEIILLLFGAEYRDAYMPFTILMIYVMLLFIREIYGYSLNAWHLEKKYLKIVGLSAAVNLGLNMVLTPIYGMNIAAAITVLSEVINLVYMRKVVQNIVDVSILSEFKKVMLPSVAMALLILFMKSVHFNIILILLSAIISYIAASFYMRIITISQVKEFLSRKSGV